MESQERTRYDVAAMVGLALAIAAVITLTLPLVSILLSASAVVIELQSRQSLRTDPALGGATVGAIGFVVAVVAFLLVAAPHVISFVIPLFAGLS